MADLTTVPALDAKLDELRQCLPYAPAFQPANGSVRAFYLSLRRAAGWKDELPADGEEKEKALGALDKQWERYRKSNRLPHELVLGLTILFPALVRDVLLLPTLEEFRSALSPAPRAFHSAKRAADYFAQNRSKLVRVFHEYYGGPSDFPMLYKPGWILEKPVELTPETDRALLKWQPTPPPLHLPEVPGTGFVYHDLKQRLNDQLRWRGSDTYRLLDVGITKGAMTLTFTHGFYLDYLDTCEFLGLEAAAAHIAACTKAGSNPDRTEISPEAMRAAALPERGGEPGIYEFAKRSAAVGISTLLIVRNYYTAERGRREDTCFYHIRNQNVAEGPGTLHVVPAGTFEPDGDKDQYHARDFSIRRNILRELAEELLGKEEVEKARLAGEDFLTDKTNKEIAPFAKLLANGKAKLYFFGVAVDPVTTKPEIITCLFYEYDDLVKANFRSKIIFRGNHEGEHRPFPFTKDNLVKFGHRDAMVPAGAASLLLTARHFESLKLG